MNFLGCYCHLALLSVRDSTASLALFPACPLAKTTLPFLPHTPADRIHPIAGHTTPHLRKQSRPVLCSHSSLRTRGQYSKAKPTPPAGSKPSEHRPSDSDMTVLVCFRPPLLAHIIPDHEEPLPTSHHRPPERLLVLHHAITHILHLSGTLYYMIDKIRQIRG